MDLLFAFHFRQMEPGGNIGLFSKPQASIFKASIDG
jgi:hypothetical protein